MSKLIVDRPKLYSEGRQKSRWNPVGVLNTLSEKYDNLRVGFLKDTAKTIFEILTDDKQLVVTNEPPLGVRPKELLARSFSGYLLLNQSQIHSYVTSHLEGSKIDVVESLRLRKERHKRSTAGSKPHDTHGLKKR